MGWAILAVTLMLLSLNRFFLSSRFGIAPEGLIAQYPFRTYRVSWPEVLRWAADDRVAVVTLRSTASGESHSKRRPSRAARRIQLLLGPKPDEVLACLAHYAPRSPS
jgi:hypothetical protein